MCCGVICMGEDCGPGVAGSGVAGALRWRNRLGGFIGACLAVVALMAIASYLYVVSQRIGYPFELEWMEGACVDQVQRIIDGKALYVKPTLDFVPFAYAPLYFYASAWLSGPVGGGFMPLRLISVLSSVGCFALIYAIVFWETGDRFAGMLAAAFFAATFGISGFWFDIGRVDSLFCLLLLCTIFVLRFLRGGWFSVLAGILAFLSFLTKQAALFVVVPILLGLPRDRQTLVYAGTLGLLLAGSTAYFDLASGGWYSYYVFFLTPQHKWQENVYLDFWVNDVMGPLPVATVFLILYLLRTLPPRGKGGMFYIVLTAAMLGGSWVSRLQVGGYYNVLMPAYSLMAVVLGLSYKSMRDASKKPDGWGTILVHFLLLMQFLMLMYDPARAIPTAADEMAGTYLVENIRAVEGEVYVVHHGYLSVLAGKRSYAHAMAINDILRSGDVQIKRILMDDIINATVERRFAAIISDKDPPLIYTPNFSTSYPSRVFILKDQSVFVPVTGTRNKPVVVYLASKS
jgi:hypothetical protein